MKTLVLSVSLAILVGCASAVKTTPQRSAASAGVPPTNLVNWPVYAGDLASSKYSKLNQINKSNVANAKVLWRWNSIDQPILQSNKSLYTMYNESSPLAIDGDLYASTDLNQVAKIDGSTGQTLWSYDPQTYLDQLPPNFGFVSRGLAYWSKGNDKRVFIGTGDAYLIALDANSGQPIQNFGDHGRIDLLKGLGKGHTDWPNRWQYGVSSPAIICQNRVIVGSSINDLIIGKENPPGDVRAFDVETGKEVWRFHTLQNRVLRWSGNANVWAPMSADPALGMVYLPVSTASSDMYGGQRPSNDLFAESLVALDCKTGQRQWHYQMVHHGLWDYDPPAAPNLVDLVIDGKAVPAVVQVTKQAFAYVLNRKTGKPIWPIVERPVPASTVEKASATQPIPTKPPAFDRQGITSDDLLNFSDTKNSDLCRGDSGQDAKYCKTASEAANFGLYQEAQATVDQYVHGPLFTPPTDQKKGLLQLPGSTGGANWQGASYHPDKHLLVVSSVTKAVVALLTKNPNKPDGSAPDFAYSYSLAGATLETPAGKPPTVPLFKPPFGRLTAIDLNSGKIVWQKPLGVGPKDNDRIKAAIAGTSWENRDLGWERRGQMLMTKDLLFVGQTGAASVAGVTLVDNKGAKVVNGLKVAISETPGEQNLKAIDPDTGEVVHEISLLDGTNSSGMSGNAYGAPITYLNREGKQVIVVPVGGANLPAALVAIGVE